MPYCSIGSKAIVSYKFPEKQGEVYTTEKTPIDILIRESTATGYETGKAYQADYYTESYSSGQLSQTVHYTPTTVQSGNTTLINPPNRLYYPPFVYPGRVLNGNLLTYPCSYSNLLGQRITSFFNLLGTHQRIVDNFSDYKVRDIKWIREDGQVDKFKYELVVINNSGKEEFVDYGVGQPNFEVTCNSNKCPRNTICECDCGNVICCYGSNGQVLKTIFK